MNRTIATLATTLATTLALTACDAPDATDHEPRAKVMRSDAASLAVLAESEPEVHAALGAALELSGDGLLSRALDPAAFDDVSLTDAPRPSKGDDDEFCVDITDFFSFCWKASNSGVYVWAEVLGVASEKDYFGKHGACDSGGLDVGFASATYAVCYLGVPFRHIILAAEACWFGDCADYGYAHVFE